MFRVPHSRSGVYRSGGNVVVSTDVLVLFFGAELKAKRNNAGNGCEREGTFKRTNAIR